MFPDVQIKKILYATDLSEYAQKTFAYAVSLADHYNAGITILHVVIDSEEAFAHIHGSLSREDLKKIQKEHVKEAREVLIGKQRGNVPIREALTRICEEAKEKLEDKTFSMDEIVIAEGNPADEIVKQAVERDCDVIVMGSHGHGGLIDSWLGSVSRTVLKRSKKPVLMVRLDE